MNPRNLTVVMYHYVRPISSRFPKMHCLPPVDFADQLKYLAKEFHILHPTELRTHQVTNKPAALLSFDDGLSDHLEYVVPQLKRMGLPAVFFPLCHQRRTLLPFHRLHYVLASGVSPSVVTRDLKSVFESVREEFGLPDWKSLYAEYAKPYGFDTADIIFLKRLVQRIQPREAADYLSWRLFQMHISLDEEKLAEASYPKATQWRELQKDGFVVGGHTKEHLWLPDLSKEEQRKEIEGSVIPPGEANWLFAFPYGAYNEHTLDLLSEFGCEFAFTTEPRTARDFLKSPLTIPRLDTNHFPRR